MSRLTIRQVDNLLDEFKFKTEDRISIKKYMVENKMMDDNFRSANTIRKLLKHVFNGGRLIRVKGRMIPE